MQRPGTQRGRCRAGRSSSHTGLGTSCQRCWPASVWPDASRVEAAPAALAGRGTWSTAVLLNEAARYTH
eukprot:9716923-Alexandrium_andersonii.AAC.1